MQKILTPGDLGYRMPAEWECHAATQLHWPSNTETWPGERLEKAEKVYLDIIENLHTFEPIVLLVDVQLNLDEVVRKLQNRDINLSQIAIHSLPINDVWARDCGPIFIRRLKDGKEAFALTDWEYNAWGEKYPPFDSDNRLPQWFSETFGIERFEPKMVLEGGSIDTNGEGVILTTEAVLMNPNRNPGLSMLETEERLKDFLGANQVIWLKDGLAGDDTDGHIDDLSRFLNKNTILTMISEDKNSINYETLQHNFERLKSARNAQGEPFHLVTLPLPETKTDEVTVDGSEHVPASYANFYIANGVVLVPMYDERYDEQALDLFKEFFPGRTIIGIECTDLVWGQGSIHCITQQLYGEADFLNH